MLIRPPTAPDRAVIARWTGAIVHAGETSTTHAWRVVVIDTFPVGCIEWRVTDTTAQVHTLYVDPAWRRRGAGRALLAVAMRRCRLLGATTMSMWVAQPDPVAQRFLGEMGFEPDQNAIRPLGAGRAEIRFDGILPAGLAFARGD